MDLPFRHLRFFAGYGAEIQLLHDQFELGKRNGVHESTDDAIDLYLGESVSLRRVSRFHVFCDGFREVELLYIICRVYAFISDTVGERVVRYALEGSTQPLAVTSYTYEALPADEQATLPSPAAITAALEHEKQPDADS